MNLKTLTRIILFPWIGYHRRLWYRSYTNGKIVAELLPVNISTNTEQVERITVFLSAFYLLFNMELNALDTKTLRELRLHYNKELSAAIQQEKNRLELCRIACIVLDIQQAIREKERKVLEEYQL